MVLLSVVVAIGAAYGGLRVFLARQDGIRLIASSIAFGIAVSGMHYTAMHGMHFVPMSAAAHHHGRRARRLAANALDRGGGALFCDRGRLPAVAGAGSAPSRRRVVGR